MPTLTEQTFQDTDTQKNVVAALKYIPEYPQLNHRKYFAGDPSPL